MSNNGETGLKVSMEDGGLLRRALVNSKTAIGSGLRDLFVAPKGNLPGLDALRSLAILLVISGHYCSRFAENASQPMTAWKLPLFSFGWTGVDLFFVLSGYLIGRQLWKELIKRNTIDAGRFLLRRGLRIWPFYYCFALWAIIASPAPAIDFLPDLLFVSNYLKHQISGGWSLSTEEHFYILIPVLLLITRVVVPFRRQYLMILVLFLTLPILRYFWLAASKGGGFDAIYFPFHTHSDGLVVGLFISWLSIAKPAAIAPRGILSNAVTPLIMIAAGGALYLANRLIFGFSALALIYGAMVLFVLRDESFVSAALRFRGFHLMSRLSYGMYLIHFPVLVFGMPLLASLTGTNAGQAGFWLGGLGILCATFAISAVTFILIESPFLRFRDRRLGAGA